MSFTQSEMAELTAMSVEHKNRSLNEKMAEAERKKHDEATLTLPKKLYNQSTAMGRFALSCALFGFGRGPREQLNVTLPTFGNGRVAYEGPELRQDDLAVLEGLISLTRDKKLLTDALEFHPGSFCADIGWSNSTGDKDKLLKSLERLSKGCVRIVIDSKTGGLFHLVGDIEWSPDEWVVRLSPTIRKLFDGGQTFLPLAYRQLLTDGLQTWLAGFLRAWANVERFETEDLLKYSGSKASLKEFGRDLRAALAKLESAGIIKGFEAGKGWISVQH